MVLLRFVWSMSEQVGGAVFVGAGTFFDGCGGEFGDRGSPSGALGFADVAPHRGVSEVEVLVAFACGERVRGLMGQRGQSEGLLERSHGPVGWGRRCRTVGVRRQLCAWCRRMTAIAYLSFDWHSARTWPDLLVVGSCPIEQRGSDFRFQRRVMISVTTSAAWRGVLRSTVLGRHLLMLLWRSQRPQSSAPPSGSSSPTRWPVSRSEPVPRWSSASCCERSSPENELLCWSAARNNSATVFVAEAVGAEVLCPGYHRKKCRFERPLAERRKTGTDPVKPLDTLSVPAASSYLPGLQ